MIWGCLLIMIYSCSFSGLTCQRRFASAISRHERLSVSQRAKLENQTDCSPTIYLCGEDNTNVGAHTRVHTHALHYTQHTQTQIPILLTAEDSMLNIGYSITATCIVHFSLYCVKAFTPTTLSFITDVTEAWFTFFLNNFALCISMKGVCVY